MVILYLSDCVATCKVLTSLIFFYNRTHGVISRIDKYIFTSINYRNIRRKVTNITIINYPSLFTFTQHAARVVLRIILTI